MNVNAVHLRVFLPIPFQTPTCSPSQAVQSQHDRCVSALLEGHADPNLVDINGNTALHLAASIPSSSTAALLLEHEAGINAQNKARAPSLCTALRSLFPRSSHPTGIDRQENRLLTRTAKQIGYWGALYTYPCIIVVLIMYCT